MRRTYAFLCCSVVFLSLSSSAGRAPPPPRHWCYKLSRRSRRLRRRCHRRSPRRCCPAGPPGQEPHYHDSDALGLGSRPSISVDLCGGGNWYIVWTPYLRSSRFVCLSTLHSVLCRPNWSTFTDPPKRTSSETWSNEGTLTPLLHHNNGRTS